MSKKILKRSLALGALMAFVITGSAFADGNHSLDHVFDHEQHSHFSGLGSETIKVFFEKGLQKNMKLDRDPISYGTHCGKGCVEWEYNTADPDAPDTYLFELNGNTLEINGGIHVGAKDKFEITGTNGSALYLNGNLGIAGTVEIDKLNITNGGLWTYGSKMEVTTQSLVINYDVPVYGIGINANGAPGGITINTKDLTVYGAITSAWENAVNITADKVNIANGTDGILACLDSSINLKATQGVIESNVYAGGVYGGKGTVDLTLGSGVTLTGSVVTDTASESASNITLNGATWKVTGDSNITALAGNDGKIVLGLRNEPAAAAYSLRSTGNNNAFYGLQIGDLTNSNLEVSGGAELTEAIENGTVDMTAEEALQQLADAVKTGENSQEETVSKVTIEAGETLGATSATIGEDGTIASITQDVNPQAAKVSKAATNLKAHYRAHMNDMNKRMGELRMANGEAGVWTRMVRGESEYEGAKMQYNQYQLGYDEKLSVDKRWTVGAAVTFAEGDGSYGQGSTDDKSTAFAIYGSKLNNDGTFVDLIARYAHLESDMEDSVYCNGDYSTNGYSVSAEFGKRIQQGNGLWVEPQVELTYGTIDSANFKLGTGYNAHFDSMDSFIARVGFSIGKDIKEGNVYARASYLYDFDGETTSLVTKNGIGTPTPEDFGGGWWEVGVGANINLSKATYIYADIEKTFGGEVDTNWQWNLGVRYSF